MIGPPQGAGVRWLLALALLATAAPVLADAGAAAGWIEVDYSQLVDRRRLSHSGEPVGALLDRLGGRPLPAAGEQPADRHAHSLLEPLLEPYAVVLPDALDAVAESQQRAWIEVGRLWQPGDAQPAWAELLFARRYVLESDGEGHWRAILPWRVDPSDAALPTTDARVAAQAAWDAAWPVLRHVFAAERRRLAGPGGQPPALAVAVHPYRHLPERLAFQIGATELALTVDDTRADGARPPFDLATWNAFFASGLRLEGARLDDGDVRPLGSRTPERPTLLGEPVGLADLAVAYRAVLHGGLTEAYMSLDRGHTPMRSIVNYGGRLRDTSLGWVSLLCDIRFKTFSLGIDIAEGQDVRERLRGELPEFRTHLERLAEHPESRSMAGQQTRLWFYPDDVDLTLSEQGDVLVLRRVRMTAASERLAEGGLAASGEEVRPWTRATVEAINRDYDQLMRFFPEMSDLDRVVGLLSLMAWLKQAQAEGLLVPELESLLAVELPSLATPRTYPQLLAFNALPPPGSSTAVTVYDRVPVGEALDRLYPADGRPLAATRRYQRAVAALDPSQAEHAALLREFEGLDVGGLDEIQVDLLAQQAERLRMHHTVLATLESPHRRELGERLQRGERLRMFSVGIGGLDLGMGPAVERARARREGDAQAGRATVARRATESRESWRVDPPGLPAAVLPEHGLPGGLAAGAATSEQGHQRVEFRGGDAPWILTLYGKDGPETSSRRVLLDRRRRATGFERLDERRLLRYAFARDGRRLVAEPAADRGPGAAEAEPPAAGRELPPGLVLLHVDRPTAAPLESPDVALRLEAWIDGSSRQLAAGFPRPVLQRLVQGRVVDRTPGQPLPGLAPLPDALGAARALMVVPRAERWLAPWVAEPPLLPGEDDALRLARSLGEWWAADGDGAIAAIVGVDAEASPRRWAAAPRAYAPAVLVLPRAGFSGALAGWRERLATAWGSPPADELPDLDQASLVLLVSGEPPGAFAVRLREMARDRRMRGKLLAAWSLSGPVREDLPAALIGEGLAGVGVAEDSLVARREAERTLAALRAVLEGAGRAGRRVEELPGPFLWHF